MKELYCLTWNVMKVDLLTVSVSGQAWKSTNMFLAQQAPPNRVSFIITSVAEGRAKKKKKNR